MASTNARGRSSETVHTSETPTDEEKAQRERDLERDLANMDAKDDSAEAKSDSGEGLYVIVATTREGQRLTELHDHESAEARYHQLTYRGEEQGDGTFHGGGSFEIKHDDVHVYKLSASDHSFR